MNYLFQKSQHMKLFVKLRKVESLDQVHTKCGNSKEEKFVQVKKSE